MCRFGTKMKSDTIPEDEPITAYKILAYLPDLRIYLSPYRRSIWKNRRMNVPILPTQRNMAGIHAFLTVEDVRKFTERLSMSSTYRIVEVQVWGKVVRHSVDETNPWLWTRYGQRRFVNETDGIRAQYARIVRVCAYCQIGR